MGLAIILYLLGLSYEAVAIVLASLGIGIGKTSVYRAVQAVSKRVPGLKREALVDDLLILIVGLPIQQSDKPAKIYETYQFAFTT